MRTPRRVADSRRIAKKGELKFCSSVERTWSCIKKIWCLKNEMIRKGRTRNFSSPEHLWTFNRILNPRDRQPLSRLPKTQPSVNWDFWAFFELHYLISYFSQFCLPRLDDCHQITRRREKMKVWKINWKKNLGFSRLSLLFTEEHLPTIHELVSDNRQDQISCCRADLSASVSVCISCRVDDRAHSCINNK